MNGILKKMENSQLIEVPVCPYECSLVHCNSRALLILHVPYFIEYSEVKTYILDSWEKRLQDFNYEVLDKGVVHLVLLPTN